MLRQRLQSCKGATRQATSPLRLRSAALCADISVISVAYMDGEQLQSWLRGWKDKRARQSGKRLPVLLSSRIQPSSASFQQRISQPFHSPRASQKPQDEASPVPSVSTDDRSPPCNYEPHHEQRFPMEREVSWSERKPEVSLDQEASFRIVHYPLSLNASCEHSFSTATRNPSPEPFPPIVRGEVKHLYASFPREVFGGRPTRRRTKPSN
jgi:hypothetical protein